MDVKIHWVAGTTTLSIAASHALRVPSGACLISTSICVLSELFSTARCDARFFSEKFSVSRFFILFLAACRARKATSRLRMTRAAFLSRAIGAMSEEGTCWWWCVGRSRARGGGLCGLRRVRARRSSVRRRRRCAGERASGSDSVRGG